MHLTTTACLLPCFSEITILTLPLGLGCSIFPLEIPVAAATADGDISLSSVSRRIYVWYLEETLSDLSGTVADNVLLLDEPTSALDPLSTQNIEDVLLKLKKQQGLTVIMVSHSVKQTQRIADVVCLLMNYLKPSIPWHKGSLNSVLKTCLLFYTLS
ncbi:hypothetical protein NC651_015442 [Populus alba x Populus x berolinensis]|nr:hypothetical protein NC651_015442 [Populus alba x Populus x berolinensis]